MTPAQTRTAVDTRLANLWPTVQAKEDAYFTANGRYWQGLKTHSVLPADGATVLPDIGATCPGYQPGQPWPNAILTTPIEMALEIHQYLGPQGAGYVAMCFVTIAGATWTRSAQVGPESWRQAGWAQVGSVTP